MDGKEMIWNRLEVRSRLNEEIKYKCVGSIWVINFGAIEISCDRHTLARSLARMHANQ